MKDYTRYKVSDFLIDDDFLGQHLKPTKASEKFWQGWAKTHTNSDYFEAVETLQLIRLGLTNYQSNSLSTEAKLLIFNKIQKTNNTKSFFVINSKSILWLGAAAAIIIISFVAIYLQADTTLNRNLAEIDKNIIERHNPLSKPILVHLPDGSAVILNPNSKIWYPIIFEKEKRLVRLSGEATFDIAKEPARPFFVIAQEVTTKVLGTRFNIKAFNNMKDVVVSVQEGKVSVFKNSKTPQKENELKGVVLLPNQQAIFDRETDQYDKKLINSPVIINRQKEVSFEFNEEPINEVFRRIEQAYGIEIVYDQSLLAECQVTGTFENESLFQKLDIITKIIGGSYEVLEGKILINSRGCK